VGRSRLNAADIRESSSFVLNCLTVGDSPAPMSSALNSLASWPWAGAKHSGPVGRWLRRRCVSGPGEEGVTPRTE
jgi:hypothetical protein